MRMSATFAVAVVCLSAAARAAPTHGGEETRRKEGRILSDRFSGGGEEVELQSSSSSWSSRTAEGASNGKQSTAPCNCTAVPALTLGLSQNVVPTSPSLVFLLNGSSIVALQEGVIQVSEWKEWSTTCMCTHACAVNQSMATAPFTRAVICIELNVA